MAESSYIRNPIEWAWAQFKSGKRAAGSAAHAIHGNAADARAARPVIKRIGTADIRDALALGLKDFGACRTDVLFLCLIYPVLGLVIWRVAFGYDLLPLLFPLASGFALLGPVAAVGLYEMSRRREQGRDVNWADAFAVVRSPAFGAVAALSLVLLAIFLAWLGVAQLIYMWTLGPEPPVSLAAFVSDVFLTPAGWTMIAVGTSVGFVFAVFVLAISVVSFPLLLDRNLGLAVAVRTSLRAFRANVGPMFLWGAIVAGLLVLGTIPALVGLIVVMPVLGHATWHLYRRVVG